MPVVDEKEHVIGLLYRQDVMGSKPDATARSLAHVQFPVAYSHEVVHHVADRFLAGGYGHALVLNRETGELAGMLTAFDILKARNWQVMQEMSEPSRFSGTSLLRFDTPHRAGDTESEPE